MQRRHQVSDDSTEGQQGVGASVEDRLAPPIKCVDNLENKFIDKATQKFCICCSFKIHPQASSYFSSFFFSVVHSMLIWSNKTCSHVTLAALLLLGGAAEQTY